MGDTCETCSGQGTITDYTGNTATCPNCAGSKIQPSIQGHTGTGPAAQGSSGADLDTGGGDMGVSY